jgi:hypothetical protein
MSILKGDVVNVAVVAAAFAIILFTVAAAIYIRFDYAAVMPRSPQPESGRVYPIKAQYGGVVYVNERELERYDFIKYDLMTVSAVSSLVVFGIGWSLGWLVKRS